MVNDEIVEMVRALPCPNTATASERAACFCAIWPLLEKGMENEDVV